MLKLLLTVVVVALALMIWFGKGRAATRRKPASPDTSLPQPMAACERCGVHLPRSEAFIDDAGRFFCGAEHRRLGPTHRPRP